MRLRLCLSAAAAATFALLSMVGPWAGAEEEAVMDQDDDELEDEDEDEEEEEKEEEDPEEEEEEEPGEACDGAARLLEPADGMRM